MFKPVLFFISLLLASCTGETPITVEASLSPRKETAAASNITEGKRCIVAIYKRSQFTIYHDGNGAAALIGKEAVQIACQPFESNPGEWTASNPDTGDYIVLNVATGVTRGNIKGMCFVEMP